MTGHKKYPHVPCDSVVLKLDEVVRCLEGFLVAVSSLGGDAEMERMATEALEGLREVIARRGKELWIQRRRRGVPGTYMTVR